MCHLQLYTKRGCKRKCFPFLCIAQSNRLHGRRNIAKRESTNVFPSAFVLLPHSSRLHARQHRQGANARAAIFTLHRYVKMRHRRRAALVADTIYSFGDSALLNFAKNFAGKLRRTCYTNDGQSSEVSIQFALLPLSNTSASFFLTVRPCKPLKVMYVRPVQTCFGARSRTETCDSSLEPPLKCGFSAL
jgi:hypothetical protein